MQHLILRNFLLRHGGLALFVLAVLVRVIAWIHEPQISRDGVLYIQMAQKMATISPVNFYLEPPLNWIPPLFPQVVAWGIRCGFKAEAFAVGFNVFCGSLTVTILYFCMKILFPSNVVPALGSGLAAVFSPTMIDISISCLRESSYLLFCASCVYLLINQLKHRTICSAVAYGICCALAAFCRFEALELIGLFCGGIIADGMILWREEQGFSNVLRFQKLLSREGKLVGLAIIGFLIAFGCGLLVFQLPAQFLHRQLFRLSCRWISIIQ